MNKNIIKLAIALVVAILVYSVFWFFKVGQVEKKISAFISDNSTFVSAADISVSGFPFSQKIVIKDLKFSIPHSPLSKYEIMVKNIEAKTGIFSSDFSTTIDANAVSLMDSDEKILNVEFNQAPKIDFLLSDEGFAQISYQDNGHKALDGNKNVVYSASGSMLSFISNINDEGKIINKVDVNVRDVVGFDMVDLYKSSLEKRIINGLKTGEITINSPAPATGNLAQNLNALAGSAATPTAATATAAVTNTPAAAATTTATATKTDSATTTASTPNAIGAAIVNDASNALKDLKPEDKAMVKDVLAQAPAAAAAAPATANNAAPATPATPTTPTTPTAETANTTVAPAMPTNNVAMNATTDSAASAAKEENKPAEPVKSNLTISLEFFASDAQAPQVAVPLDPTKIQEAAQTGSQGKTIKINNLEFSNNLYKLYVNGELNSFHDDNSLSGSISIKIEKIANLTASLLEGLKNILADRKTMANSDVAATSPDPNASTDNGASALEPKEDLYKTFLNKLIANLDPISKELAAKNPVSKEDVAVFDIRREKNLEFLINETSIREVLGKL